MQEKVDLHVDRQLRPMLHCIDVASSLGSKQISRNKFAHRWDSSFAKSSKRTKSGFGPPLSASNVATSIEKVSTDKFLDTNRKKCKSRSIDLNQIEFRGDFLANLKRKLPIKDPLYGYTHFTYFEREIINHPFFQRLHFVLQNSTVYVAFPSNKNSRFSHSLGVAELAGKMFQKAISNSTADVVTAYLTQIAEIIKQMYPRERRRRDEFEEMEKSWREWLSNSSQYAYHPFFDDGKSEARTPHGLRAEIGGFSSEFLINTCWVVTRICGLVHDIGHLPMSHSFEHALEDVLDISELHDIDKDRLTDYAEQLSSKRFEIQSNETEADDKESYAIQLAHLLNIDTKTLDDLLSGLPIHEARGLMMLDYIRFNPETEYSNKEDESYRNLILRLCVVVLFSAAIDGHRTDSNAYQKLLGGKNLSALRMMKSIVAGEVDADRLDYVARDGLSCGTTVGQFDKDRIINNALLVKTDSGNIVLAFYHRAVQGIEQFFQERYEGYKYLIYHRTASRSEAALRELIGRVFHYAYLRPQSFIANILDDGGYVTIEHPSRPNAKIVDLLPANGINQAQVDDANFRTMMSLILRKIDDEISEFDSAEDSDDVHLLNTIKLLLEIFLQRKFINVWNPFSSRNFEQRVAHYAKSDDDTDLVRWKENISKTMRTTNSRQAIITFLKNHAATEYDGAVLPIFSYSPPKVFKKATNNDDYKSIYIVDDQENVNKIETYSVKLRTMFDETWAEECFSIAFVAEKIKINKDLIEICENLCEKLFEEICDQYMGGEKTC